jgi:acyl-CoA reductase-like NAD-dependent aldehyde dehydrogenase
VVAEGGLATPAQIDALLDRAVAAQRSWRQVPLPERAEVIGRLVTWMVDRNDAIGRELTCHMGRPVTHSPLELTSSVAERATWLAGAAARALADTEVEPREGCGRIIRHEPVGVVLVVAPWNYPYLCSVNAVVPALLAGDAVVLKVSSQTPLVADSWDASLTAAGLPDGVHCMVADRRVGFLAFAG